MVLKNVYENEEEVQVIMFEIKAILEKNLPGLEKYITYYKPYSYLLDGRETKSLDSFFLIDPFPLLNVSKKGSITFFK